MRPNWRALSGVVAWFLKGESPHDGLVRWLFCGGKHPASIAGDHEHGGSNDRNVILNPRSRIGLPVPSLVTTFHFVVVSLLGRSNANGSRAKVVIF